MEEGRSQTNVVVSVSRSCKIRRKEKINVPKSIRFDTIAVVSSYLRSSEVDLSTAHMQIHHDSLFPHIFPPTRPMKATSGSMESP
jgi:hypothetical protein